MLKSNLFMAGIVLVAATAVAYWFFAPRETALRREFRSPEDKERHEQLVQARLNAVLAAVENAEVGYGPEAGRQMFDDAKRLVRQFVGHAKDEREMHVWSDVHKAAEEAYRQKYTAGPNQEEMKP